MLGWHVLTVLLDYFVTGSNVSVWKASRSNTSKSAFIFFNDGTDLLGGST